MDARLVNRTVRDGVAGYQTRPMTVGQAEAFKRCLEANPAFSKAQVIPCLVKRTHSRVLFQPRNSERMRALLNTLQAVQTERAETVKYREVRPGVFSCRGKDGIYLTTEKGCSCPHYQWRLRSSGLECKHMQAIRYGRDSGRVLD